MRTKKQPEIQKKASKISKINAFAEPTPKEPSPVTPMPICTYENPTGFCDHSYLD